MCEFVYNKRLGMLLSVLGVSLFGNMLAGKGVGVG